MPPNLGQRGAVGLSRPFEKASKNGRETLKRFGGAVLIALMVLAPAQADGQSIRQCGAGKRVTCVVDGDTLWLQGEKIRLSGIDAPELSEPRCRSERERAQRATDRLVTLMNGNRIEIRRTGVDRYQRTLADVMVDGVDVGAVLVREGLARAWDGRRRPWC